MIDFTNFRQKPAEEAGPVKVGGKTKRHGAEERWWESPEGDAHDAVFALLRALDREQSPRKVANQSHSHLYGEKEYRPLTGDFTRRASAIAALTQIRRPTITYNLIRVAVDTLCAKLSKAKPKATFDSDGGTWSQHRRAKRLDRFCYGAMYSGGYYKAARRAFRDAAVRDIGFVKVDLADDGRTIVFERILPDEVLVGESDGRYGAPRTLLQRKWVPRDVLIALVPKLDPDASEEEVASRQEAIRLAKAAEFSVDRIAALGDMVEVVMAWHLPSYKGAEDGRYTVAVDGATLRDRQWKRMRFPFIPYRFSERMEGYYGQGVAEQLAGRQRTINMKLRSINDALRLMSVPRYFAKTGSKFDVKQLTNEVGVVMTGLAPPQVVSGNVVPPELFSSVERDIQQGLEEVGVSMLSATARKPAGLDSAPSLREYNDIESERFVLVGQMYEEAALEAAQIVIDIAREEAEAENPLEVRTSSKRRGVTRYESISWKDVELDEGCYELKTFPASSLPTNPAAKRKSVAELYEAGLIDGETYRRELDLPDTTAENSLAFAARDDIDYTIELFLDGDDEPDNDVYQPPEPYQDLQWGLKRFQSAYLRARMQGAPEGRLELLRRWMAQAQALLDVAAQASQPPPPAAGPMDPLQAGLSGGAPVPMAPGAQPLPPGLMPGV